MYPRRTRPFRKCYRYHQPPLVEGAPLPQYRAPARRMRGRQQTPLSARYRSRSRSATTATSRSNHLFWIPCNAPPTTHLFPTGMGAMEDVVVTAPLQPPFAPGQSHITATRVGSTCLQPPPLIARLDTHSVRAQQKSPSSMRSLPMARSSSTHYPSGSGSLPMRCSWLPTRSSPNMATIQRTSHTSRASYSASVRTGTRRRWSTNSDPC